MADDIELVARGEIARVAHINNEGYQAVLEFPNGSFATVTANADPLTFDEGDVVIVNTALGRIDPAPDDAWPDQPWVGVVRIKLDDLTVVEINGSHRLIETTTPDYEPGNTVLGRDSPTSSTASTAPQQPAHCQAPALAPPSSAKSPKPTTEPSPPIQPATAARSSHSNSQPCPRRIPTKQHALEPRSAASRASSSEDSTQISSSETLGIRTLPASQERSSAHLETSIDLRAARKFAVAQPGFDRSMDLVGQLSNLALP